MEQYMLRQNGTNDCGNAVAKMLLAICHKNHDFLRLKLDDCLNDFAKIRDFTALYGVELQGIKTEDFEAFYQIKRIMIIQIVRNNSKHFLLIKRRGRRYQVNDPGYGSYVLTKEDLFSCFTGFYLEITHHKSKGVILSHNDLITVPYAKKNLVLFTLLHVISLLSLSIAIYILNKPTHLLYSFSLIALSFIFYIISRHFFFTLSTNYDENSVRLLLDKRKESFLTVFQAVQKMKTNLISPFLTITSSALICAMILVLLGINDKLLLVVALAMILLLVIVSRQKGLRLFKYFSIEVLIEQMAKSLEHRQESLKTIQDQTHRIVKKDLFLEIITDAGIVFLLLLVMAANQVISLNYLLLYFFLLIYLKSNVKVLLNWPETMSDYYNTLNQYEDLARKS